MVSWALLGIVPQVPNKIHTSLSLLFFLFCFSWSFLAVLKRPCGTGDNPGLLDQRDKTQWIGVHALQARHPNLIREPYGFLSTSEEKNLSTELEVATKHCRVWLQIQTKRKQRIRFLHAKYLFSLMRVLSGASKTYTLKKTQTKKPHPFSAKSKNPSLYPLSEYKKLV